MLMILMIPLTPSNWRISGWSSSEGVYKECNLIPIAFWKTTLVMIWLNLLPMKWTLLTTCNLYVVCWFFRLITSLKVLRKKIESWLTSCTILFQVNLNLNEVIQLLHSHKLSTRTIYLCLEMLKMYNLKVISVKRWLVIKMML